MAKQLIKEAYRMQQLAGLINENYVDLAPINSPFNESEEIGEALDTKKIDSKIQNDEELLKKVKEAMAKAEKGDTSDLRDLLNPKMNLFRMNEDDDMEDVESDEGDKPYDYSPEFDTNDDAEPTAKDVKAGDTLAKTAGSKQGKLDMLMKLKDQFLAKWKNGELTTAEYKDKTTNYTTQDGKKLNIPMLIKQLQADIDRDLTVDDEDEY